MKECRGFTLIELTIVVAIIAILAAIALPAHQNHVAKSQLTTALADIGSGRSMYEAKLIADTITSFNPSDIGLTASTPRCSAIHLVSGVDGHIECIVRGNPLVHATTVRITRSASGAWACSTDASIPATTKPNHCS